ncbi:NoeD protein [Bradyrhizobium japonicum USDA 6]|jgi:hypothetical protein|nr:NoeD protein [Bradyrhizobium japonicum USDA 6]
MPRSAQPDFDGSVLRALFIETNTESHARAGHQISPCAAAKVRYVHEQILAVAIVRPNEPPALFNAVRHYCSGAHVCSTVLRLDIAAYYSGAAGALSVPNSAATSASEDERHHLNILTHLASQQTGGADQALEATSPPLTLPHLETR